MENRNWVLFCVKFHTAQDCRVKVYVGVFFSIENILVEINFLHKKKVVSPHSIFHFSNIDDIDTVDMSNIISEVELISERRGHYTFANIDTNCF